LKEKYTGVAVMNYRLIIIGGSAGSFQVVNQMLAKLPQDFKIPIVLVLHRLKHIRHGFVEALSQRSVLPVLEPDDKTIIKPGTVYLAPANYHLFIEVNGRFALSTEEPVNHSRPAIDLSFKTAAYCFREKIIGIILSGANKDGADGLKAIKKAGGLAIVQDPLEAQIPVMPASAIERTGQVDHVLKSDDIISFLCKL
jgi:two-component system, chemotaxis family, protein-glutamate methylesterase/glutaminase